MELPPKPKLEHRVRMGENGEVIKELTPESEVIHADYLMAVRLARAAKFRMETE